MWWYYREYSVAVYRSPFQKTSTSMASVRQKKKGIRAVSSPPPEASSLPRPVVSPNEPHSTTSRARVSDLSPPKPPAGAAVVQSARNKGKRSPSATAPPPSSTTSRGKSSPTHLVGGAAGARCAWKCGRFQLAWCRDGCSTVSSYVIAHWF